MKKPVLLFLIACISAHAEPGNDPAGIYSVKAPLAPRSLLLDAATAGGMIVAVGERGHILISKDGKTWRQAVVPTRATLTGVYFHDASLGWAVGHDSVILRTKDGGNTWEKIFEAPEAEAPLLDVLFRDVKNGIAVGAYGSYLVTGNGGDTWEKIEFTASESLVAIGGSPAEEDPEFGDFGDLYELHLNSISRSATGKLYIAAEAGRIYRSDDDGKSWLELPSPYAGSLFGVLPLDNESLLVFGLRGYLFRSDDAGLSWQAIESHTQEMLTNAIRPANGTIFLVGLGGTVLASTDDGRSFSAIDPGSRNSYAAVVQNSEGEIIVVGEYGAEKL